jgi:anaerobic ribonucleoside-triphosphate reductase
MQVYVINIEGVISMKNNSEKIVGEGVKFERIRRITGYLVGTVDRFNNGKKAEVKDRVKHSTVGLNYNKENK